MEFLREINELKGTAWLQEQNKQFHFSEYWDKNMGTLQVIDNEY